MRSWLQSTFKAHIPAEVQVGIKTVKKYTKYLTATASPQSVTGMSEDDVWIPSMREIFGGSSYETGSPATYVNWYDTTAKRTKYHPYMDPVSYLTRTANNVRHIHIITNAGASGTVATSNSSYRILLGFCT